jgi:hypothetical protein
MRRFIFGSSGVSGAITFWLPASPPPQSAQPKQNIHKMPPLSSKLDRKLRAAEESSDDSENYEVTDRSSSESVLEFGAGEVVGSDSEGGDGSGDEDEEMVSVFAMCWNVLLTRCSQTHPRTTKCRHR